MTIKRIKLDLVSGPGFLVKDNVISTELIDKIAERMPELHPVRASNHNIKYVESDKVAQMTDMAVWWSQQLNWEEIHAINHIVSPIVKLHLETATLHQSNILCINPFTNWINPQIDTPHKFEAFNFDKRFLGIQVAIPIMKTESDMIGVFSSSQKVNFDIGLCYKGYYTEWFKQNCTRPLIKPGSIIFYNTRTLHSSMPNKSARPCHLLLMTYVDSDTIEHINRIGGT